MKISLHIEFFRVARHTLISASRYQISREQSPLKIVPALVIGVGISPYEEDRSKEEHA